MNIVQRTEQLYRSFSENRLDDTMHLVDESIVIHAHAFGITLHGKEGFRGFLQGFKSAFPDIVISNEYVVSSDNDVAVQFSARGTHTGTLHTPAGDIPPTGKVVDFTVAEFMQWKEGKLVSLHNYQDSGSLMRQIGIA